MIILPIFTLLIILNPLFASLTYKHVFPSFLEYERLTWLMLVPIVIAFSFTEIIEQANPKTKYRCWAALLIILLLLPSRNPFFKYIVPSHNPYKINDSVLEICKALDDDTQETFNNWDINKPTRQELLDNDTRPRVLVQSDTVQLNEDNLLYWGIRQYTSHVILDNTVIDATTYTSDNFYLSDYGISYYQYFACTNDQSLKKAAQNCGLTLLTENEAYLLFKNEKESTIYFVRHGQTDANVAELLAGSGTDAMLTDTGRMQSEATGVALSNVRFSQVYTSELTRTKDTANCILSKNHYADLTAPPVTYSRLNDIYWGDVEGMPSDAILSLYPDFSEDNYIGTIDDSTFVSSIQAESKYEVASRLKSALNYIAMNTDNKGSALVIGHACMQWGLQGLLDEDDIPGLNNASITVLEYNRGVWTLKCVNVDSSVFSMVE